MHLNIRSSVPTVRTLLVHLCATAIWFTCPTIKVIGRTICRRRFYELVFCLLALVFSTGCIATQPTTVRRALAVPTYAPVRAKVVRATESNARTDAGVRLAGDALAKARASAARLAAAAPAPLQAEVHTLTLALVETGTRLDEARTANTEGRMMLHAATEEIDQKNEQLAKVEADYQAKVKEANALDRERAYWLQKHNEAVKIIWWYRARFWGPIILAGVAVVIFLLTRFTSWGARTLGPFVVGAERVAIRTTTGLSPP